MSDARSSTARWMTRLTSRMTGASEARSRRCSTSSSSPRRRLADVLDDRAHRAASLPVIALDQVRDLGTQADLDPDRRPVAKVTASTE
jgi:hypothetical protein